MESLFKKMVDVIQFRCFIRKNVKEEGEGILKNEAVSFL